MISTPLFVQILEKKQATNGAPQGHDYTVFPDSTNEVKDGAVPSSCLSSPAVFGFLFFYFFLSFLKIASLHRSFKILFCFFCFFARAGWVRFRCRSASPAFLCPVVGCTHRRPERPPPLPSPCLSLLSFYFL